MKLLFKQRIFSWLDSYDVFNEDGGIEFTVKGALSFGHLLEIYNSRGEHVGEIAEKVFSFLPTFEISDSNGTIGRIKKEFTFFKPKFTVDALGWDIEGDIFDWDYKIVSCNEVVATVSKQLFNFSDTYEIDAMDNANALHVLMVVLAIDAEKCSSNN